MLSTNNGISPEWFRDGRPIHLLLTLWDGRLEGLLWENCRTNGP